MARRPPPPAALRGARRAAGFAAFAVAVVAQAACRTPCNLDVDQPLCIDRFDAVDLLVHRIDAATPEQRATASPVAQLRGDVLLGADWALTPKDGGLFVGFPDAGAAGVLPAFTAEGACTVATRRTLTYIPDITVQRQPRLQLQIGGCTSRAQVLFTGPADFGRAVLAWPKGSGEGSDLWIAAPAEGLFRGALYGFRGGTDRPGAMRNHEVADVVLEGELPGDQLGTIVARCEDPTGGPDPVLMVAMPGWSGWPQGATAERRGAVALFRPAELPDGAWRVSDAFAVFEGDDPGDLAGMGAACGVDVDGDGLPDIVVGAPGASGAQRRSGAVYVLGGALSGTSTLGEAAAITWYGRDGDEQLGRAIALADLDGDGLADVVAGAPGLGPRGSPGAGGVRIALGADLASGSKSSTTLLGRAS